MSYIQAEDAVCRQREGHIALLIEPRTADLGTLSVNHILPSRISRIVGPFVLFDHMGPAEFPLGRGIARCPQPHIGIAAITYLFDGEFFDTGVMALGCPGTTIARAAREVSRVIAIGGHALGEQTVYWNIVHSNPARIARAKKNGREGRFPPAPSDGDFIPLPASL